MTKIRLWLHVGPAKTGTSSIQTTLRRHRDHLAAEGVLYPRIEHPVRGRSGNNHVILSRALLDDEFDFVARTIAGWEPLPDTVISSEGFPKCRTARLSWLAGELGRRYDFRVIYYMRDPIGRAVSSAGQAIKGGRTSYAAILADPAPRLHFRRQIEMLTESFGRERMMLRRFVPAAFRGGDLIADFCHAIGRPGLLDGCARVRKDGAITMEDIPWIEAQHGFRSAESAAEAAGAEPFVAGRRFGLPPAYLEAVMRNSAEDLDWLRETWGIDFRTPADGSAPPGRSG